MTQEKYQKAMMFAGEKHWNQKVPGLQANYLLHISNVVMEVILAHSFRKTFNLDLAVQIAILHDTLEDTNTSFEEIEKLFGVQVANSVLALTKNQNLTSKQEKIMDSLNRIHLLTNEVGIVKLADRITNLQRPPDHWSREKRTNYLAEAKIIAKSLKDKNDYLYQRILKKISAYEEYVI